MTEAAPGTPHDTSLDYLEVDLGAPSGFIPNRTSASITVEGMCPRCAGLTRIVFRVASPDRKPATKTLFERLRRGRRQGHGLQPSGSDDGSSEEATVFCECGAVHPKRPVGATDNGCGAYWTVRL